MVTCIRLLGCLILVGVIVSSGSFLDAQQPNKAAKRSVTPKATPPKETASKPPTHQVKKGPFKVDLSLKGIFESKEMNELAIRPEAWTPEVRGILTVMSAVEHGTHVHKGDTLVSLDLEKIDQAIKDLELERRLTELSIKQAEEELPVLEKSTPLELVAAEHSKKVADEDLKHFLEVGRPETEKGAHFYVKVAGHWLEYANEELRQLEKMYRAKDLTEETEEIILKRQRNAVEQAAYHLKTAEISRDEALKIELPRKEITLKDNALKQTLLLDKARNILPLTLTQKRLALNKLKYEQDKTSQKLHKFQKDREVMTVKAPTDGIVYYGKCVRGQWTTAESMAGKLQRGGVLGPDEVFLTIVKPRPMFVRAVVEEKDLHQVHPGMKGKVVTVPFPDFKPAASIEMVSAIPVTPGKFEARIAVNLSKEADVLLPGMACKVNLVPYLKEDAIVVPAGAVFTDELDDDKHYVYLVPTDAKEGKDGKHEKHPVTVGKKNDGKIEIVQGLKEGDEILLEKPGDKKAASSKKGDS